MPLPFVIATRLFATFETSKMTEDKIVMKVVELDVARPFVALMPIKSAVVNVIAIVTPRPLEVDQPVSVYFIDDVAAD